MSQTFEMKLRPDPFNRICSGEKTIEYRLHDEKRDQLNKGDYIRFTMISEEETRRTVLAKIVDIISAPSFVLLKQKLIEKRYLMNESFSPIEMRKYYSNEDEIKYGVLGIKIRVVDSGNCGQ